MSLTIRHPVQTVSARFVIVVYTTSAVVSYTASPSDLIAAAGHHATRRTVVSEAYIRDRNCFVTGRLILEAMMSSEILFRIIRRDLS